MEYPGLVDRARGYLESGASSCKENDVSEEVLGMTARQTRYLLGAVSLSENGEYQDSLAVEKAAGLEREIGSEPTNGKLLRAEFISVGDLEGSVAVTDLGRFAAQRYLDTFYSE